MSEEWVEPYLEPSGSIVEYRYVVYSEGLALFKERNPVRRANIARQLADWTATLAEMEAAEARKSLEGQEVGGRSQEAEF
jgi:hypothetical protein